MRRICSRVKRFWFWPGFDVFDAAGNPIKQAAAISTVFSLLATVVTFVRHFREYNWRLGLTFLICVCIGVPVGVYFLDRASEKSCCAPSES